MWPFSRQWTAPSPQHCRCARHLDDALLATVLPRAAAWLDEAGEDVPPTTIGSLIDHEELGVEPPEPGGEPDEELLEEGFHYSLWLGDAARLHYDDEATPVATVLGQHRGIRKAQQEDREIILIKAPRLCPDGALTALALSLADPRVRLARAPD
ncbi:hypothetical protein [Ornithinimicrobium cryptoxanthini]|uniref:hypothetical protein n=1 Tax=Ornithinimicrobium cryptoxanthini TaxID=2934161 RepID=UPI0021178BD5|nr:hypothetical protein [Ornithinimicrobium cryptoxanthini]